MSELLYSPASYGVDPGSRDAPRPRGRINAHLAVSGSDLWLYGGIVEVGDGEKSREVTLDDLWRVNLDKCDGWEVRCRPRLRGRRSGLVGGIQRPS